MPPQDSGRSDAPWQKGVSMDDHPNRKWPRLKGHDYAAEGYYFLTICTKDRECLLSKVIGNGISAPIVELTESGRVAERYIQGIPGIEKYVIMPNHIHLIIHKTNGKPVASDVRSFKGLTTKKTGKSIWQDYYYDHVIRDENDYLKKWNYIDGNPAKWIDDEYHP